MILSGFRFLLLEVNEVSAIAETYFGKIISLPLYPKPFTTVIGAFGSIRNPLQQCLGFREFPKPISAVFGAFGSSRNHFTRVFGTFGSQ